MTNSPSKPTLKRLPFYYKAVCQLCVEEGEFVSSSQLAVHIGIDESQVRKDFSSIKFRGKSSAGFNKSDLKVHLENLLGLNVSKDAFIVGVGHLGTAIACCGNNSTYGLNVLTLFDQDSFKVGNFVDGKEIFHLTKLPNLIYRLGVKAVILTVPTHQAQEVADFLVVSGVKAIWNFSQCKLKVPESVVVKDEDILDSFIDFSILVSQRLNIWDSYIDVESSDKLQ